MGAGMCRPTILILFVFYREVCMGCGHVYNPDPVCYLQGGL